MIAVHDNADDRRAVKVRFAPGTDLAEARVRCPQWNPLWDRVRHEFWSDVSPTTQPPIAPDRHVR